MIPRLPRLQTCRSVTFSGDYIFGEGIVTNISESGCKVHSLNQPIPVGTSLALHVSLHRPQSPLQVANAVVRWSKGREFGLELLLVQPAEQDRLRDFMSAATRPKMCVAA